VQVDPIIPRLKPPGTKRLKLNCDMLLLTSAFKFDLRRYTEVALRTAVCQAGSDCSPIVYRCTRAHPFRAPMDEVTLDRA